MAIHEGSTKSSASPVRRPLTSLDTNTGTFSASNSPMQSPVSARVPRPLSSRGSLGSTRRRSGGIGMPGSPSFSFFEDSEVNEPVCLSCASSAATVAESSEQVTELASRLRVSEDRVDALTLEGSALSSSLSCTRDNLAASEEQVAALESERVSLSTQLATELHMHTQAQLRVTLLEEERTALNNMLSTERDFRAHSEQQVEMLAQTVHKLEAKMVRVKAALEKSKQDNAEVRETLQRERDTHSNLLLRHTIELEAAALAASQRAEDFTAQLELFRALAAGPTATIAALEQEVRTKNSELADITDQMASQAEAMRMSDAQLHTLREDFQSREDSLQLANTVVQESLRAQLCDMEVMCGRLDSFAQRRNDEAIELAVHLEALQTQHEVDLASLTSRLQEATQACETGQWEVMRCETEMRALGISLNDRTVVAAELNLKLAELESDLEVRASSLQQSSHTIATLESQVVELQTQLQKDVFRAEQDVLDTVTKFEMQRNADSEQAQLRITEIQQAHALTLEAAREQMTERQRSVDELNVQLRDKDAEVQLLSATLMSQSEVKHLLAAAQSESSAQTDELERLRRQFAEQTEDVALKRNAMVARIALLTEDLLSRDALVESLKGTNEVMLSEKSTEIDSLLEKLHVTEVSVTELTQHSATLRSESQVLNEKHTGVCESLKSLQEQHRSLQDRLRALEATAEVEKGALVEQIADLEHRFEEELQAAQSRAAEVVTLESELCAMAARCRELDEQVLEHSILAASFEAQRLVWQSTVAERDQLQAESVGETVELSGQLQQYLLRIQTLESALGESEGELELFKVCNERVSTERDEAQEQLESVSGALETARIDLALLQARTHNLENDYARLEQENLSQSSAIAATHEEKLTKLRQRLVSAEQESTQRTIEAEVLRTKLRECEIAIAESQGVLAKRNMELDVLEQSRRETERLKDAAEVKFTELEESYLRVVGNLEVRIADLAIEKSTLLESASELRNINVATESALLESSTTIVELQEATVRYQDEIETLTAELSEQRQAVLTVYADLNKQASALVDLEAQLAEQSTQFESERTAMLEGLQAQQVSFCNQFAELQQKSDHAVSSLRSNLLASLALGQSEVEGLVAKLAVREAQFESLSAQYEEVSQRVEKEHDECNSLRSSNMQVESSVVALIAQLESAQVKIRELSESMAERELEVTHLHSAIEALEVELSTAGQHAVEREESIYGLQLCVQATETDRLALQKTFNAAATAHLSAVTEAAERLRVAVLERDALQADYDVVVASASDLTAEVTFLSAALLTAQNTVIALQAAADDASTRHNCSIAELTVSWENSLVTVAALEVRLQEFEASGASSSEQMRITLEQRDALRVELSTATEKLIEQESVRSTLQAEYAALTLSAKETDELLRLSRDAVTDTQEQLQMTWESAEARRMQCETDATLIVTLQSAVASLESEVGDVRAESSVVVTKLSEDFNATQLQLDQLRGVNIEQCAAAEGLAMELRDLQRLHEEMMAASESAAINHSSTVAELSARFAALELRSGDTATELSAVVQERNELRSARGTLTMQVMNLQDSVATLQRLLDQSREKLQENSVALAATEKLLQDTREECVALETQLAVHNSEVMSLTAEIAASQAALLAAEESVASLTCIAVVRKDEAKALAISTAAQIGELESHIASAQQCVAKHEATIDQLNVQIVDLEKTRVALDRAADSAEETRLSVLLEHSARVEGLERRLHDFETLGTNSFEQLRLTLEHRDALQIELHAYCADLQSAKQVVVDMEAAAEEASMANAGVVASLTSRLAEAEQFHLTSIEEQKQYVLQFQQLRKDLERTIADAEDQLATLRGDLQHQDDIHREAMAAVETERAQWKSLSAQHDTALVKVKKELQCADLECTSLLVEVTSSQVSERALSMEVCELKRLVKMLESALVDLSECVVDRNQELDALSERLSADVANLNTSIGQNEMTICELRDQLQTAEESLLLAQAASASEAESHTATLRETEHRLREFEALRASSSDQLRLTLEQRDTLLTQHSELLASIAVLEAEVQAANSALLASRKDVSDLEASAQGASLTHASALEVLNKTVEDVRLEMENCRMTAADSLHLAAEEHTRLKQDLITAQEAVATFEASVLDLQAELTLQRSQHGESVSSLQSDVAEKSRSLRETLAALILSEKRVGVLDLECSALSSETFDLRENERLLWTKIDQLMQSANRAEAAVRDLDASVVEHSHELSVLDATNVALTAEVDSSLKHTATLNDQLSVLRSEVTQDNLSHAEAVSQLRAELQQSADTCSERERINQQLANEIGSLTASLEVTQQCVAHLQVCAEEMASAHSAAVSDYSAQIEDMESRSTSIVAELKSRLLELESLHASTAEQLLLTVDQRKTYSTELVAMTLQYGVLSRQLIEHIELVGEYEHELSALQDSVYSSEATALRSQAKLYAAESALRELDWNCIEANRDNDDLRVTIVDFAVKHQSSLEIVSNLEVCVAQREDTIQTLQNTFDSTVADHECVMAEQNKQHESVEKKHAETVQELEKRLREFKALGASSSEQLALALQQRDALQTECCALQQSITSLVDQLSSLQIISNQQTAAHLEEVAAFHIRHEQLLEKQESDASVLQSEITVLHASLAAADQTIADLKSCADASAAMSMEELSQANALRTSVQTELNAALQRLCALADQLSSAHAELRQQTRDHTNAVTSLRSELSQRSACLLEVSQALAGAEQRMEQTSAEMKTYDSLLTSAETQLANYTAEISQLKEAIAEADSTRLQLEESVALCRAENAQLEDQRCAAELRCSSLESNLLDVEKNLRIALKETATLAAQLLENNSHIESLTAAAQGSEETLQAQIAQLCTDMSAMQEELRQANLNLIEQTHQSDAQVTLLTSTVQSLQESIADLEAQLTSASADSVTRSEAMDRLSEELVTAHNAHTEVENALASQISSLSSELAAAQEEIKLVTEVSAEKDAQCDDLHGRLDNSAAQLGQHLARIGELDESVQTLSERIVAKQAELEHTQSTFETAKLDFAVERDELLTQSVSLNTAVENLELTVSQLREQVASMSSDLNAQMESIEHLKDQLATAQDDLSAAQQKLTSEIVTLSSELTAAQEKITNLCAAFTEKEAELQALEMLSSERSGLIVAREERIAELEAAAQMLTVRSSATEAELASTQCELEEMKASLSTERSEFQSQVITLRDNIAQLEEHLSVMSADSVAHVGTIDQLEVQLSISRSALADAEKAFSSQVADLSSALDTAQNQVSEATNVSIKLESRCQALQAELIEQGVQVDVRIARIAELEVEVQTLTERIESTQAELEMSRSDLMSANALFVTEKETLHLQEAAMTESIRNLQSTVTQLEDQLSTATADSIAHIEVIDDLTEQLRASRAAHTSAEESVAELVVLNAELASTETERDGRIADLEAKLLALQTTTESQTAEVSSALVQCKKEQKKVQQLTKRLQQSEESVRTLELRVSEGSTALGELKDELRRADNQIDVLLADATSAASRFKELQSKLSQEEVLRSAADETSQCLNVQIGELQDSFDLLQARLTVASEESVVHVEAIRHLTEQLAESRDSHATAEEIVSKFAVLNSDLCTTAEERAVQNAELRTQLDDLQSYSAAQLAAAGDTAVQLDLRLNQIVAQYEQEQCMVRDLTLKLSDVSAMLTEAQVDCARAAAEIESLKTDAVAATAHGQNLEQLLAESRDAHSNSETSAVHLRAEMDACQLSLDTISQQLTTSETTLAELHTQMAQKDASITTLEKQLVFSRGEVNELESFVTKLSDQLSQAESQTAALATEIVNKGAQIALLEQQLLANAEKSVSSENKLREASASVIADLQTQLTELTAQLAVAMTGADEQQKLSATRDAELDAVQRDLAAVHEGLASALSIAEQEQSAHELESLSLNGKIAESEFAVKELSMEVDRLTLELQQHKETVVEAEARVQELSVAMQTMIQEKAALESNLTNLEVEYARVLASVSDLQSATSTTNAKLQLDQASLHELATELVEAKAAFQHCQVQLKEQKIAASALKSELAHKNESLLLLEHRLAERTSTESTLQFEVTTFQQHEQTLKVELKRSQIDVSALTARLHESAAELSHLSDSHANELSQLHQGIQQREVVLQELNDRLLEQMEENDELKRQMQEATANSGKMNRDLRERNAQLEELHVEHGVLGAQEHIHSKEISDLRAQLHTAETALNNLKQELHVRTLESADLAVSMKQRQGGIQQLTVTLTDKDKQIQQLHSEMSATRTKLHATEEKAAKLDIQVKSLSNVVSDLRQSLTAQEKLLEHERSVWSEDSANLIARIQENEFIIQELNDRIVENEEVIAGYESRAQETVSEKQRLESQFLNIREKLQLNLAQCAESKQIVVSTVPVIPMDVSMSSDSICAHDQILQQKDDELAAQAASWNSRFEDLEVHTAQRVAGIREALTTQFEAQAAAQHIESHMLEDKIATLEGLLAAAQQELQQYHESHPEPTEADSVVTALATEEMRALQSGVSRLRAKVASKSKQILLLNQQMLRDRQNFQKLKRSLVKLDELKAAVFANNFNPAVPAPPLPANQVSELYHLGMEEATKKIHLEQQALLVQQQEEFQVICAQLESTLESIEHQGSSSTSDGVATLSETISALHAELRDTAAAHQESQRQVHEMRERCSSREAAHYLALSEKTVECNALRAALHDLEKKRSSGEEVEGVQTEASLREQLFVAQNELQVMTLRQAEGSQKFQRAVRTIKVLEARGDSLKEECAAANAEILKLHQKADSRKK